MLSFPVLNRLLPSLLLVGAVVFVGGLLPPPTAAQPIPVDDAFAQAPVYGVRGFAGLEAGTDSELCFTMNTELDNIEMACTDGSSVRQVTNVNVAGFSGPNLGITFQGALYFGAENAVGEDNLYRYDGTTVELVSSIERPQEFAIFDGALYFQAVSSVDGNELFRYDGSSVEVVDPLSGDNRFPEDLTVFGNQLCFSGDNSTVDNELFCTDGTTIAQPGAVNTSGSDAKAQGLAAYNGALYFSGDRGQGNGEQLIQYDGTSYEEVFPDTPNGSGLAPRELTVMDGDLYYTAETTDGREIFRLNESSGTLFQSQATQFERLGATPSGLQVYDGRLYFQASASATTGNELYSVGSFGSSATLEADLNPSGSSSPNDLTVFDGALYFRARLGNTDSQIDRLHRFDGSGATSVQAANHIHEDGPSVERFRNAVYDGDLYFQANDLATGRELYRTDGSTVEQVADYVAGSDGLSPRQLIAYDGRLLFTGSSPTTGSELHAYDGTSISLVEEVTSGSGGSFPFPLTRHDGFLYFTAEDSNGDRELYRTDGTSVDLFEDINGTGSAFDLLRFLPSLTSYDGELYFAAQTDNTGRELFRTNGFSVENVQDIASGSDHSTPQDLTVFNGRLFFTADDGTSGEELFGYDAPTNALQLIDDLNPSGDGVRGPLLPYNGRLYFAGTDGTDGIELYAYDGFSVSRVADINTGSGDAYPDDFAVYNNRLYFTAVTEETGREPYSYDGTTVDQVEIVPGPVSGGGRNPTVFDDGSGPRLFVTATDNQSGIELYAFTTSTAPLPVELTSFTASSDGPAVRLAWTTASETGNTGFRVQRRVDDAPAASSPFQTIHFEEGASTTTEPQTYRFVDGDVPFDAERVAYRLQQVDVDGSVHTSAPVTVARGVPSSLILHAPFPNPAARGVTLQYELPEATEVRIAVYDVLGREVARPITQKQLAGRTQTRLSLSGLASGVYFVRLTAAGSTQTRRLTITQ